MGWLDVCNIEGTNIWDYENGVFLDFFKNNLGVVFGAISSINLKDDHSFLLCFP